TEGCRRAPASGGGDFASSAALRDRWQRALAWTAAGRARRSSFTAAPAAVRLSSFKEYLVGSSARCRFVIAAALHPLLAALAAPASAAPAAAADESAPASGVAAEPYAAPPVAGAAAPDPTAPGPPAPPAATPDAHACGSAVSQAAAA